MDRGDRGGGHLTPGIGRRPVPRLPLPPLAVLASLLAAAGCGRDAPTPPSWHEEDGYRWRELRVREGPSVGFTALDPSAIGIGFVNAVPEDTILANEILGSGSGVAVGDADGDGRPDLYFGAVMGENALYLNRGDWEFEEVTEQAGVGLPGVPTRGVVFADVDGDGYEDLVVTVHGGRNVLLENDGSGVFRRREEEAGFRREGASTTAALADVDGDGDLDLYVANHKYRFARDLFSPDELSFEARFERRGDSVVVRPKYREHFRAFRVRGQWREEELAEPDEFYLNDGTGRFEEVPWTGGRFLDADGRPLEEAPRGWGLAARFYDVDGDGHPDLYVCNDIATEDLFFLNDGRGRFVQASRTAFRSTSSASMAVDFSDIDRDGEVDFLVTEMLALDPVRRKTQVRGLDPEPTLPGEVERRLEVKRNTLQLNRGDGTFAEIAWYAGLAASEWTFGTLFLDADLDGYEDVFVTTGHVHDILDGDTSERLRRLEERVDSRKARLMFPTLRVRNLAFRNLGGWKFEEVGEAWGFSAGADISHGIATGDLDGDGDLDIVVTRLNDPPLIYRNDSGAPRIAVRLRGAPPNTRGVGAVVRLRGGPVEEQSKEVTAGGMYLSGSEPLVAFAASKDEDHVLSVEWRSGRRSVIEEARPNRLYEVEESGAGDRMRADGAPSEPKTHFVDASEMLGHRHVEEPFFEFARQPLLPFRLSQLGPGVSWEDVDGDGDPDLLVASGRGGGLALYRNEGGGRLARVDLGVEVAAWDQTTVLGFPDGRGGKALLVGQSNYEAASPEAALAVPSVVRYELGSGLGRVSGRVSPEVSVAVPGSRSATGPLALADVDGDGDLDLFVGGRVGPTVYPLPASSRLYRHEGGRLVEDEAAGRLLEGAGLVSAAVLADVDGDGSADLVLAVEWGPVRLYLNDGRGGFREATGEWGLAEWPGRWNGLAVGDLDGDGRLDLVATSWGENTGRGASRERPLMVFAADFDRNGTLDVLHARAETEGGVPVPLEGLEELTRAVPALRRRAPTYAAYAGATLEDLLGVSQSGAYRAEAVTLSHTVFWNRGGRYEAEPLPVEAQWAPSFYVGVADLDGDGAEDVFLTQNFFATDPETPRYDAGRSLWLKGDGRGGLEAVPGRRSGIRIYGDPRGAALADYDGDGRIDIAVSQNGGPTVLLRNVGVVPGLRVRLAGPAGNPEGVGAAVRLVYEDGSRGPARAVVAGSGYWSRDGAVQVLGVAEGKRPRGVWARWPGGAETETPVEPGAREVTLRMPSGSDRGTHPSR